MLFLFSTIFLVLNAWSIFVVGTCNCIFYKFLVFNVQLMFLVALTFAPVFQLIPIFLFKINVLSCYTFFLIYNFILFLSLWCLINVSSCNYLFALSSPFHVCVFPCPLWNSPKARWSKVTSDFNNNNLCIVK